MTFRKLVFSTLVIRSLSFVMGVWTSVITYRGLGPEARGLLTYLVFIIGLITSFADVGSSSAGVYLVGSKKLSLRDFKRVIQTLIIGISAIIWAAIIYYFWFHMDAKTAESYHKVRELMILLVPLAVFSQLWSGVVYAENRVFVFNFSQFTTQLVSTLLLTFAFVTHQVTLPFAFVTLLVSHLVQMSYLLSASRPVLQLGCDWNALKSVFKLGATAYVGNLSSYAMYRFSYFLIADRLGAAALGIYSLAVLLSEKILDLTNASSVVLLPQIANKPFTKEMRDRTSLIARTSLILTVGISVFFVPVAPTLIHVMYGDSYSGAVLCLAWLLPGTLALSTGKILSAHMCGEGKIWSTCYPGIFLLPAFIASLWFGLAHGRIVAAAQVTSIFYILVSLWLVRNYMRHSHLSSGEVFSFRRDDLERIIRWK